METIKSSIAQVIRVMGIMAVVAAFAAAAFPTSSFAASNRLGGASDYGKIAITVYDASGPTASFIPVKGATVEIVNLAADVVVKAATNDDGNARVAIAEGSYKVRVSANGFYSNGTYADVKNGQVTSVSVGLTRVPTTTPSISLAGN